LNIDYGLTNIHESFFEDFLNFHLIRFKLAIARINEKTGYANILFFFVQLNKDLKDNEHLKSVMQNAKKHTA